MRLDLYLVEHGLAPTRQRAANLIREELVSVDGKIVTKPSAETEGKTVRILGQGLRFVSRGGLKLESALQKFGVDPTGLVCLDLGASTGGFTDCLLQSGAIKVYALDVGFGQLDRSLRENPKVVVMEHFNARDLKPSDLNEPPDLIVSDLSFISQRLVYSAISGVIADGARFISLIKPQFEVGRAAVGKNGIVKDRAEHIRAIAELTSAASACGLFLVALSPSPITGGDGNREYLALFSKLQSGEVQTVSDYDIKKAVYEN